MLLKRIIGHRGAAAYAPENTITSFRKAASLGCRFVEFDVMLSQDGEAFVFHDEQLKRTTNGVGYFGNSTSAYIRSLDAGSWFSKGFQGEKVPTFQEVIIWLAANNVQANIEIKPCPGTTEQTTCEVLSQLKEHWPNTKSLPLISSFEHSALYLCHEIVPEIPLGLLLHQWENDWLQKAQDLRCFSINVHHRILTKARVAAIKQQQYQVCAYTVNRKSIALKLFNWGVDAVFSDHPDLLGPLVYGDDVV